MATKTELNKKKVVELKRMANMLDISLPKKVKKAALVELILKKKSSRALKKKEDFCKLSMDTKRKLFEEARNKFKAAYKQRVAEIRKKDAEIEKLKKRIKVLEKKH